MGKSLPRKCNSCEKAIKNNFVRHAKACPTGFTEWTFLDHTGDVIPKEKLKRSPKRVYGADDGEKIGKHADGSDSGTRAWSKLKRLGFSKCTEKD